MNGLGIGRNRGISFLAEALGKGQGRDCYTIRDGLGSRDFVSRGLENGHGRGLFGGRELASTEGLSQRDSSLLVELVGRHVL